MKKFYTCALVLALAISVSALAATTFDAHAAAATTTNDAASNVAIGATVADFKLPDANGKEHSLSSLKGTRGTVLIFVSTQCPVSNGYNARMEKLAQDYKAKGINIVGINSNAAEMADQIKAHAAENKLAFPILKDKHNKIADQLGARVTPEAYYLDASNKLVYRGRIDNSRNGESITSSELRDALEATLAGKPVEKSEVSAFGCSIKRAS